MAIPDEVVSSGVARARTEGLGASLLAVRSKRGYSLRAVAQMSGLSTEAVSAVERGVRYPSLDTLERLAAALEFTVVIGPDRTELFY